MMSYRKLENIQAKIKEEGEMCLTGTGSKFTAQLLPPCPGGGLTIELQNRPTTGRTIHTTVAVSLSRVRLSHEHSLSLSAGFSLGSTWGAWGVMRTKGRRGKGKGWVSHAVKKKRRGKGKKKEGERGPDSGREEEGIRERKKKKEGGA
jgi:hypothetical protein